MKIYRAASAQLSGVTVTLIFFFGTVSVQPRAGRIAGIFAEAQVPYEKIMGCAKFGGAVRAASCCKSAATRVNRCDGRDKTRRPKPNGRDESSSNSPLIISYRPISIGLLRNVRYPALLTSHGKAPGHWQEGLRVRVGISGLSLCLGRITLGPGVTVHTSGQRPALIIAC